MTRFLIIWTIVGFTLKYIFREKYSKRISDVVMAQVFVNEHPELKATWKQLNDGRIRIKPLKGEPFYLKDGVITSY